VPALLQALELSTAWRGVLCPAITAAAASRKPATSHTAWNA